jgi:hypothetical protein
MKDLDVLFFILQPILPLFALLVAFQLKHWVCDYLLQGEYMAGKFRDGWGWILPLASHCAVHAATTFAIVTYAAQDWWLGAVCAGFDFLVHFAMDRIKASPNLMGRWKALSAKEYVQLRGDLANEPKGWCYNTTYYDDLRRSKRDNRKFWLCLGADQLVHALTHYVIIFVTFIVMP